ncbi:MAG: dipicolinate synthase subunit B [Lachnospiraceae bacterium]
MNLEGKKIGFAVTGSFCTLARALAAAKSMTEQGAELYPVFSEAVQSMDTKFGLAKDWEQEFKAVCGRDIIKTVVDAEPIGPGNFLDCMVVVPCSGNTLSKLAGGITDGPVLMAVKAHLRNGRPAVLAISTNDGLSKNLQNIATVINSKNIYLVPFSQDDPVKKPYSLVAQIEMTKETAELALEGIQIQPVLTK